MKEMQTIEDPFLYGCKEDRELRALWPDPWEAPEVPSKFLLQTLIEEGFSGNDDLEEQMRTLPNCRRAMADLEAENLLDQFLPVKEEDENLPEFIKALKPMEPDSGGEKTIPFADHSWGDFVMRVGSVCSTKNEIPFLSDGTLVYRKVFSPTIVLILEEGKGSADENSWVVAPCEERLASPDGISSEADYSFSHDGFEYLARLDLATEVLESQLDRLLDAIDPTEETFREKTSRSWDAEDRFGDILVDTDDLYWKQAIARTELLKEIALLLHLVKTMNSKES